MLAIVCWQKQVTIKALTMPKSSVMILEPPRARVYGDLPEMCGDRSAAYPTRKAAVTATLLPAQQLRERWPHGRHRYRGARVIITRREAITRHQETATVRETE